MKEQVSYKNDSEGKLYLVPTPIGNLEDMTFRSVAVLKEADLIACEDTRRTVKLCNHFDINVKLVSYHEHNKQASGERLLEDLTAGKTVALVSDAGTPAVSDPGRELVASCVAEGIPVIPLPGANAAVSTFIASGLDHDRFYFYGFLPRKKKERTEILSRLAGFPDALVFYEAPHRLKETLAALHDVLGNRRITLGRELTKQHEHFLRGTLVEAISHFEENDPRGEFCLIVEGNDNPDEVETETGSLWWEDLSLEAHVDALVNEQGFSSKAAIKEVAKTRGLPKRDVYQAYHVE